MVGRIGIVGGGLAGLSCAYYLEQLGYSPILFEQSGQIGGKLSTEQCEGFLLDRGFQVFLTSYSELKKLVKPYELSPAPFRSILRIYYDKRWHSLCNPLKHPLSVFQERNLPFISFGDKVKLGALYFKGALKQSEPFFHPNRPSMTAFLEKEGISHDCLEAVIRPFFGGILLNRSLGGSDELFLWLLRFFMEGVPSLPKQGIQAIATTMASRLKRTEIRFGSTVCAVDGRSIYLEGEEEVICEKIALAVGKEEAQRLVSSLPEMGLCSATSLYFWIAASDLKEPPEPILYLNGTGEGPINHLAFVSVVQPSYAPSGKILTSVTVLDEEWSSSPQLVHEVAQQLSEWFGPLPSCWHHLKSYQLSNAIPEQSSPPPLQRQYQLDRHPDIYLCGEYVAPPSIDSAIGSGRHAATAIDEGVKRMAAVTKESS